jgi:TolB-like protein/DNA-binding winged helix-turn-helix (wHTH) protein
VKPVQKAPRLSRIIKFGVFEVDLEAGELRKSGMRQKLGGQAFEVLHLLLEHPREVVTREQLQQHIWPQNTFVDYDLALKKAVNRIREVLGDSAESPRFIETVPRRGYRFIAPISDNGQDEVAHAQTIPISAGRRYQLSMAGPAAALFLVLLAVFGVVELRTRFRASAAPRITSLAVLPLRNLSSDPNQEYFSDGLTDELITDLAQIGSVKVISHTSTMRYKDAKKSLPEIAHELNVDGIIEGTVQQSGDRVHITAQLIHGPSDKHLWAKSYERDLRDVFGLEREVTGDIARQVQGQLTATGQAQLTATSRGQLTPVNLNALEAYLQGNYHLRKGMMGVRDKELRMAGEYFQHAIDAAPDFAMAYVGLAEAHNVLFFPSSEDFSIMRGAAEKAVALDPGSSEAWTELASTKWNDWDWAGAEEEFRKAIALNTNNTDAHDALGNVLDATGRLEEGWREFEIAQALDPKNNHLSDPLYRRGDYDRAIELLQKTLSPEDAVQRYSLAQNYALKEMYREWVRELGESFILFGFPDSASRIRQAFSASGYLGARRQEAKELEQWAATKKDYSPCVLAEVYTSLGDKDRAFYWLRDGIDHHRLAMNDDLNWFKVLPELAPLRPDPRFKDLLRRAGLPP